MELEEGEMSMTAPMNLRGRANDDETGSTGSDGESYGQAAQILTGKAKDKEKVPLSQEEMEERKKKRRKRAAFFLLLLLLIGVIVAVLLFLPGSEQTPRAETGLEATDAPTLSPTPSVDNETEVTGAPVATPTPPPTFADDEFLSRLSCAELLVNPDLTKFEEGIAFKQNFTVAGKELCGDTYVGFPENPERNPWTAKLGQKNCEKFNFDEGTQICEEVGARRCTADELQFGASQGTGCNGDNDLLFSATPGDEGDGPGIYAVNLQLKKDFQTFFECKTDLTERTLVRCCADHAKNFVLN